MPHHGDGPIPARIMLVGEAWGEQEELHGRPFVGASGEELNRMLHEVGILRSECYVSNVVNHRPQDNDLSHWIAFKKNQRTPQHTPMGMEHQLWVLPIVREGYKQLLTEIEMVKPNIILTFGNLALWALTEKWGVTKWRGSHLRAFGKAPEDSSAPKVIPSIHPASVLREWSQRADVLEDLRRVKRHMDSRVWSPPARKYIIRPRFEIVTATLYTLLDMLSSGPVWMDFDIETKSGHIECFSISWSRTEAICVPLMDGGPGYWSEEEEVKILWLVRQVMSHKNARVRWQNGLYDAQYTHRWWLFVPRGGQDTMISQHTLWSDKQKALYYQASLYCDWYVYWKDEGKSTNPKLTPEVRWKYNCDDCVYTREVGEVEQATVQMFATRAVGDPPRPYWPDAERIHAFQQAMFWPVLRAMTRGLRVHEANASKLIMEVMEQKAIREQFMQDVLGFQINIDSPKQMQALFYEDLQQPKIMTRAKKGVPAHVTCDDDALKKIASREPLLLPLCNTIADIRTLDNFMEFLNARRGPDKRMRSSFNIGGSESGKSAPKTYRLSSSKDAFGSGGNLQTIPSEKSKSVGKWSQRQHFSMIGDPYSLPNLRSMYCPDTGFEFFDQDLDRADLQVMAWDADEPLLKEALKKKVDLHLLNVYVLDAKDPPPLEELVETHPKYPDHRGPRKLKREFAKVFCHATDYLGKARTVAAHTGRTIHETERAQKIYLGTYSGIAKWQQRIIEQVNKYRFVENRFGYRWYIFDRINDQVMPEAVAWIPQSTVSIVINKIWMSLFQWRPESEWKLDVDSLYEMFLKPPSPVEVLLQVHDSLAGQFPSHMKSTLIPKIQELSQIVIPYDDPLIIPTGIGTSAVSWGEC